MLTLLLVHVSVGSPAVATAGPAQRVTEVGAGAPLDLQAAVASAKAGDTIRVSGGIHRGPIQIDIAVHLVGIDLPVIDGGGQGSVVVMSAPNASLSGFRVTASGDRNYLEDAGILVEARAVVEDNVLDDVLYGISLKAAPGSVVRNNRISGRDLFVARRGDAIRVWESHGSVIEGNHVSGMRDMVIWYSDEVIVRNNVVENGRYGLHTMYTHRARFEGNRLVGNSVGAFLMYSSDVELVRNTVSGNHGPSGQGVALKDCDDVTASGNVISGNRVGVYFDNSPSRRGSTNQVHGNIIAYNDIGAAFQPSVRGNVLARNGFVENLQQVAVVGGGEFAGNDWTPDGQGNYWSNYAGFDWDGDGIGDLHHVEVSLFESLLEQMPALRLFTLSPAQSAVDMAARAFPVFRPDPVLADTAPLMAPPAAEVHAIEAQGGAGRVAGGLLAVVSAIVAWGNRMDAGATYSRPRKWMRRRHDD